MLTIGYDKESLTDPEVRYTGEVVRDAYGREIPEARTWHSESGGI